MIQKNNLFATFETQEELHKYFQSHTGQGETFLLTLGAALMWNTIAHMQEKDSLERWEDLKQKYHWDEDQ
jgi:hypothetical protein